jgi:hypothetical protein
MSGKRRVTKPGKAGRSIEEVMVQRKLNASDPLSWPNLDRKNAPTNILSSSMSDVDMFRGTGVRGKKNVKFNTSMTGSLTSEQIAALEEEQRQVEVENKLSSVEPLKDYCMDLQKRCSTLEMQLQGTMKVMQKELKKQKDKAHENLEVQKIMWMKDMDLILQQKAKEGGTGSMSASALMKSKNNGPKPLMAEESTLKKINASMTELDVKVVHLKEIFRQGDPMVERKKAVTKINACVRGWLQRQRYGAYQRGQREWKWLRCRQIVWLLDMNLGLQSKLDTGINKLKLMHNVSFVYQVFTKWLHLTRQALPVRRAMYKAAMDKAQAKDRALMHKVWDAFKSVTVGGKSTKSANEKRRVMIDSIREELSDNLKAKGEIGVVPDEDVERVLYRRVLKSFLEAKRLLMMKNVLLNGFWKNVRMARKNLVVALDHRLQVHAGRIFYAWSDWVYMVGAGLDRKRWNQPRQYEIHYNQKRLDNYAHLRLKRYVFFPWKEFYVMQSLVRRMLQRQMARFVKNNFLAWRGVARELRTLRIKAVDNWRGYGRLVCLGPFQGWASYVKGVKNVNNERQRIVSSYLRWKWRQRIVIIMKRWRHQALYGRIDGLYTRQMLISSLNEQKIMSASLEKLLSSQTVEVDECRDLTEREVQKRALLEDRLKDCQEENIKNRSYAHHAEQEMKRLEGIIESMALLNPRQIEHLKKLQPQFKFKQRKVNIPRDDDEELMGEDDEGGGLGTPRAGSSLLGEEDGPLCTTCNQPLPRGMSRLDNEQQALAEQLAAQSSLVASDEGSGTGDAASTSKPGSPGALQLSPGSAGTSTAAENSRQGSPLMQQQQINRSNTQSPANASAGAAGAEPSLGTLSNSWMAGATTAGTEFAPGASMMSFSHSLHGAEPLNVVSNEDMVLLDRVKWLISRYSRPVKNDGVVAYVIPGEEKRSVVEIVPEKPPSPEKKEEGSDSSDDEEDERRNRKKGSIEDEMEVTKKSKPKSPAKPKLMTAITWTPGQLVIPKRKGILPEPTKVGLSGAYASDPEAVAATATAGEVVADGEAVVGVDGQVDTLLPGDPVHEPAGIDPEDTAARMLLGMMTFLQDGDVTTMAPEDRRDWTTEVLRSVEDAKETERLAASAEHEHQHSAHMIDHETGMPLQEVPPDHPQYHDSINSHRRQKKMSVSQRAAEVASEIIGGAKSWRNALLYLRTMHPGAGNYSGVGVELDSSESQLYKRIVDMRHLLGDVVTRQSHKMELKLEQSRDRALYRERLIVAAKARAEAEEAERVAREAEALAEKERLKAEEEAKMAAMRAARAARKLETGESDSDYDDEDDEDDEIDLVNPYAAFLNPNDFAGDGDEDDEEGDGKEQEQAM